MNSSAPHHESFAPARRPRPAPGWVLALTLALVLQAGCGGAQDDPPSVILIVVDTLRGDLAEPVLGALNTPTLDRLAREGVAFPLAFSHAPMTLPAHTALFSSRLPHESGVLNNGQSVPTHVPLLAEHLRAHGYATHGVVSLATLGARLSSPGLDDEAAGLGRGLRARWRWLR